MLLVLHCSLPSLLKLKPHLRYKLHCWQRKRSQGTDSHRHSSHWALCAKPAENIQVSLSCQEHWLAALIWWHLIFSSVISANTREFSKTPKNYDMLPLRKHQTWGSKHKNTSLGNKVQSLHDHHVRAQLGFTHSALVHFFSHQFYEWPSQLQGERA